MNPNYSTAIIFYIFALFTLLKGKIYNWLGWGYKAQVGSNLVGDAISGNPFRFLTAWISWKVWLVLWIALGSYFLYLGVEEEKKRSKTEKL